MINKPESCRPCPLWGSGRGFVPSSGSGSNGVLIVLEAPGPDEESKATQAVGKASQFLFSKLKQVGIERDDFAIHSAISCAPPFGKFEGESFEADVLTHCHEHLERTILSHIEAARSRKQQPVILTFGDVAFRRVMQIGRDDSMMKGYFTYPHLGPHGETVIGTRSTGFIIKGNQHLVPMIQFATQRAIEIAASGAHPVKWDENSDFLCDPSPTMFAAWVKAYEQALEADPSIFLAFDIETPFKSGADEEEVSREEDHDYTILRCSFAYGSDDQNIQTVSIPWSAAYLPQLRHLFSIDSNKVGWNSDNYDIPRIAKQMPLQGTYLDGMLAWHVLNSALPKGLGFVAPFYNHDLAQWKHLSADKPAIYNALDSFVTLRCWLGIQKDLKRSNLWNVFERHVMKLNKVLNYMRDKGVILDEAARNEAERRVKDVQDETNKKIQIAAEPVKIYKIYKRTPPDTTGMVQKPDIVKTKQCPNCQEIDVLMGHYKSIGKKRLKDGEAENPCHGFKSDTVQVKKMLWAKPLEFKLSAKALTRYAQLNNHRTITNPKTKAITFDKEAIMSLNLIYPDDPLYTQIGKFREAQKLHSTYIGKTDTYGNIRGGIRPHSDGRIHALFCLTGDHEVLTPSGWERLDQLKDGTAVMQWDQPSKSLSFRVPSMVTREPYQGKMIAIDGRRVSLLATPTHRIGYTYASSDKTYWRVTEAQNLPEQAYIPINGKFDCEDALEYSGLRLAIAAQADGTIRGHECRIGLHKQRKINRLIGLLDELNLPYKLSARKSTNQTVISFKQDYRWTKWFSDLSNKTFSLPVLLNVSSVALEAFVDEITKWDGYEGSYKAYFNSNKENAETVQTLLHLSGRAASIRLKPPSGWAKKNVYYVTLMNSVKGASGHSRQETCYSGNVYCVSVPSEFFLVRRNNKIFVTGNSHNPSTLRLACQNPNLQNLPRPGGKDDLATLVRHMIRAQDGHVLAGSDFSGIEAVLVGYEAQSPEYIRLAKMDVHSFYTAYCLYETTDKLSAADLPQLSWSDEKLKEHLAGIKAEFKWDRNTLYKHLVHAINFGQESRGAQAKIFRETGNKPPIATLNQVMNIYRELFPAIPKWQDAVRLKADKEGYLTNAFGYVHRFNRVYDWVKRGGQWESKLGLDASRVLAFFPQSNAAGILKEATLRLFYDHFESAGQYLRLVIHDEIFLEVPCNKVADVLELVQIEMERPIPELPIPPEWGMGSYLSIDTETKVGFRWSEME